MAVNTKTKRVLVDKPADVVECGICLMPILKTRRKTNFVAFGAIVGSNIQERVVTEFVEINFDESGAAYYEVYTRTDQPAAQHTSKRCAARRAEVDKRIAENAKN
jgi:hypothetical protein